MSCWIQLPNKGGWCESGGAAIDDDDDDGVRPDITPLGDVEFLWSSGDMFQGAIPPAPMIPPPGVGVMVGSCGHGPPALFKYGNG